MSTTREKGNIGEDIACTFLIKNGFTITDRNYYRKWGELDIVAKKNGEIHFFEVKSVISNFSTVLSSKSFKGEVVRDAKTFHVPEENVDAFKVKQLRKIIQTYLTDKDFGLDYSFQFHILSIFMNEKTRKARIKWIKNVIL